MATSGICFQTSKSSKGQTRLVHEGYTHKKNGSYIWVNRTPAHYWRCADYNTTNCCHRLTTNIGSDKGFLLPRTKIKHICTLVPEKPTCQNAMAGIKMKAKESKDTLSIVSIYTSKLEETSVAALPTNKNLAGAAARS